MPKSKPYPSSVSTKNCDGFAEREVQSALQSAGASAPKEPWTPTHDYEEVELGELTSGPRNLMLEGRVVNFFNVARPSKRHKAAQGCIKIMLADDTGVLTVRLWYADAEYCIRLGRLVTLWTVHVSNSSDHNSLAPSTAPLFTSIFPEGERNCHFMTHDNSDDGTRFKRPFNCRDAKSLSGLMTLKSFTDGGYEVADSKLLVCVKSIGAKTSYINKNGTTSELVPIPIFDDTADATLTFYGGLCASAASLQPSKTILLISNPGWRIDKTTKLTLNATSRIDIDPDTPDARRLRALAQRLTKKDHVNPPFPAIDPTPFKTAPLRALYRLSDVDEFARANPTQPLLGYLSVVLTELNIVTPCKRNMLMCNECCGVPVFDNATVTTCRRCEKHVALRVNPHILGPVIDETGQIGSGKLILSGAAWEQLLGRTAEQLVATSVDVLRYLEQRLLFLRVTMGFAMVLDDGIGRLAIWSVSN